MSDDRVAQLEKKLEALTRHVTNLEAVQEIRKTQHKYGYYIDKCLYPSIPSRMPQFPCPMSVAYGRYQQAVGMFSDSADVRVYFHGGIWYGKEGAKRLYIERFQKTFTHGRNGPRHGTTDPSSHISAFSLFFWLIVGFLLDHPMYQDVIDVSEDGMTAKGRFRCNMQAGLHESVWPKDPNAKFLAQWWEGNPHPHLLIPHHPVFPDRRRSGDWLQTVVVQVLMIGALYENEYVKEDGKWKIKVLRYRPQWHATFEKGQNPIPLRPRLCYEK